MTSVDYLKDKTFDSNIYTNLNMRITQLISSYSYLYGVINELYIDTKDTDTESANTKECLNNFNHILGLLTTCQQSLMHQMINCNKDQNDISNIISFCEFCESNIYDIYYQDNEEFLDYIDELFYGHKRIDT